METLDTAEKLAEVLALYMGAPDTQGEGIPCVMPLLANYLEIIWKWTVILSSLKYLSGEKNLEQITRVAKAHKDMSDKEIKVNYTSFSSKELKVTGPSC